MKHAVVQNMKRKENSFSVRKYKGETLNVKHKTTHNKFTIVKVY